MGATANANSLGAPIDKPSDGPLIHKFSNSWAEAEAEVASIEKEEKVARAALADAKIARAKAARGLAIQEGLCRDTKEGEQCYRAIEWSKTMGMKEHPDWYQGLSPDATIRESQWWFYNQNKANCEKPCPEIDRKLAASEMSYDEFKKYIEGGWDGKVSTTMPAQWQAAGQNAKTAP